MWPMTDAEAVVVHHYSRAVGGPGTGGRVSRPSHHTAGSPASQETAMMVSNSTKARLAGQGPGL